MAARIIFETPHQRIPLLCRGWRTPNPSPSRDLNEKPAPFMTTIEVESKDRGQDAVQREKPPTCAFPNMRTPSQSPGKRSDFIQDEVMMPRGHGPNMSVWDANHGDQDAAQREKPSTRDFPVMRTSSQSPGKGSDFIQDVVMMPLGHFPHISLGMRSIEIKMLHRRINLPLGISQSCVRHHGRQEEDRIFIRMR